MSESNNFIVKLTRDEWILTGSREESACSSRGVPGDPRLLT
jgi:hypothetical protein